MAPTDDLDLDAIQARLEREGKLKPQPPEIDKSEYDTESWADFEDVDISDQPEWLQDVKAAIERLDIFAVYDRVIGKERQQPGGRTEGIRCSCPNPGHRDDDPSAWFGYKNGKWLINCRPCGDEGFDIIKMAAVGWGMDYKDEFIEVITRMGEEFCGIYVEEHAGEKFVEKFKTDDTPKEDPSSPANVIHEPEDDEFISLEGYPDIDWKHLIKEETVTGEPTFQWSYMCQLTESDEPDAFHVMNSYIAVSLAIGRRTLLNLPDPLLGNLFICKLGGTGSGKSRSNKPLERVIEAAFPFRSDEFDVEGVRIVGTGQSGTSLVEAFHHRVTESRVPIYTPIVGYSDIDELSTCLSIGSRQGDTTRQTLMKFYDGMTERLRAVGYKARYGTSELVAYNPYCCLTTGTQIETSHVLLSKYDAASGFVNRLFFVAGAPKETELIPLDPIELDLSEPVERLKAIRAWSWQPGHERIRFEEYGRLAFNRFNKEQLKPAIASDTTDTLKRIQLHFLKLCLLTAVNEHESKITEDIVYRVAELFPYVIACYGLINTRIGISDLQRCIQELSRVFKKQCERLGHGMTVPALKRYLNGKFEDKMLNDAIKQMDIGGLITKEQRRAKEDKRSKNPRWLWIGD